MPKVFTPVMARTVFPDAYQVFTVVRVPALAMQAPGKPGKPRKTNKHTIKAISNEFVSTSKRKNKSHPNYKQWPHNARLARRGLPSEALEEGIFKYGVLFAVRGKTS